MSGWRCRKMCKQEVKREADGRCGCLCNDRRGLWRLREGRKKVVLHFGRCARAWVARTVVWTWAVRGKWSTWNPWSTIESS